MIIPKAVSFCSGMLVGFYFYPKELERLVFSYYNKESELISDELPAISSKKLPIVEGDSVKEPQDVTEKLPTSLVDLNSSKCYVVSNKSGANDLNIEMEQESTKTSPERYAISDASKTTASVTPSQSKIHIQESKSANVQPNMSVSAIPSPKTPPVIFSQLAAIPDPVTPTNSPQSSLTDVLKHATSGEKKLPQTQKLKKVHSTSRGKKKQPSHGKKKKNSKSIPQSNGSSSTDGKGPVKQSAPDKEAIAKHTKLLNAGHMNGNESNVSPTPLHVAAGSKTPVMKPMPPSSSSHASNGLIGNIIKKDPKNPPKSSDERKKKHKEAKKKKKKSHDRKGGISKGQRSHDKKKDTKKVKRSIDDEKSPFQQPSI